MARIMVLVAALVAVPRLARADSNLPAIDAIVAGIIVGGVVVGAMDISFVAVDATRLARGERIGTGLAITELVLTVPQVVAGVYITSQSHHASDTLLGLGITAVPASVVVMAIVDLARPDPPPERSWTPTLAASQSGFFAGVSGRF